MIRGRWMATLSVTAFLLAAGCGLTGPDEVHVRATGGPPAPAIGAPGVLATLTRAPLIVDGRIRVFATANEILADAPVTAAEPQEPRWSFRRRSHELVAVQAVAGIVVSRWSDGALIAFDAFTGAIAWRITAVRAQASRYYGRRTGATTLFPVENFLTAVTRTGEPVIVLSVDGQAWGYDARTGAQRWHIVFAGPVPNCRAGTFTAAGRYLTIDACSTPNVMESYDVSTGALTDRWRPESEDPHLGLFPSGCRTPNSECVAMMSVGGPERGWLLPESGPPVESHLMASPSARLVGDVVVDSADPMGRPAIAPIVGRRLSTGEELWRWSPPEGGAMMVAQEGAAVHVLTTGHELVTLEAATGAERSRFGLPAGGDRPDWSQGHVHAVAGLVMIERLHIGDSLAADDEYYVSDRPVLLVST